MPVSAPTPRDAHLPAGTKSRGPLRSGRGEPVRTISVGLLVGFAGLVLSLVVLGSLAETIRGAELNAMDAFATPFLHGLASPGLDQLMAFFTFMGSNAVIPPLFAVLAVAMIVARRPRELVFLVLASGGSLLLNELMKNVFQRARPHLPWATVPPDFSFPSGHTMNSLAFYVAAAVVLWSVLGRRAGMVAATAAVALALLVGVSRIYLGYHYFTDVLGGLFAGTAWLIMVAAAFRFGPLAKLGQVAVAADRGTPAEAAGRDAPPEAGR